MARRALTFGIRLRDRERRQTLQIRAVDGQDGGYVVEHNAPGRDVQARRHARLDDAVRDGARTWRHRLD